MGWIGRWARRSQDGALANAREASTTLSRRRVEREEVELFVRQRYADPSHGERAPITDARVVARAR